MHLSVTAEQSAAASEWYASIRAEIVATQNAAGIKRDDPYYGAIGGGLEWRFASGPDGWTASVAELHTERTLDLGPAAESAEWTRFSLDADQTAKVTAWRGREGFDGLELAFTSTSLGGIQVVRDRAAGREINVTDFESW